jgi:ABC-type lipoprotein export system ATPase subunit
MQMANEIMQLLRDLNTRFNKTILMVTHDHHVVEKCDYVINVEEDDLTNCHLGQMPRREVA